MRCTTTLPAARDADSGQQPVRSVTLAACRVRSSMSSVRIHLQLRLAFTEVPFSPHLELYGVGVAGNAECLRPGQDALAEQLDGVHVKRLHLVLARGDVISKVPYFAFED